MENPEHLMTDAAPLVSVCIANYNGMEVIEDCLRSVLKQQGSINVEILVHDDASTDRSVAYIREHFPNVVLIESSANVGFCIANNRMVTEARGQFILLLNNDAALFDDALQTLLTEANHFDQPTILTLPQFDATTGELVDRGCLLDPFFNPVPNLDIKVTNVAMVIGACLWTTKALWNELDGFPPRFISIAEDMYLCCRARLAGYRIFVSRSSGYSHCQGKTFGGNRPTGGQLQTTYKRRSLSERNKSYVMVMTSPGLQLSVTLPVHLTFIGLEGLIIALLKHDSRVWLDIYYTVFKGIWEERHQLIEARRAIQKTRKIKLNQWLKAFVKFPRKLQMLIRYGIPLIK
jgi:GT2 family glycosyltransferase